MRYLGNKENLLEQIHELLNDKGLLLHRHSFFDAFCGMGSVADSLKSNYDLIINDTLHCCTTFTAGTINSDKLSFKGLAFDPFCYLNELKPITTGFIYNNYTPGGSSRMYFSEANGAKIDAIRLQIEQWKDCNQITVDEYIYLLACLLEAVSCVANTAGVYGAFLKHWDSRARKELLLAPLHSRSKKTENTLQIYNRKIEDIVSEINCDILYLDPPYTQNQYGTQYHLLETLILNDNPPISAVTGSRPVTPMKSNWSKDKLCHILFDKVIAETKARHIIFSYNNDGFMSKDYIEATMKRYGDPMTYECREIKYKQYQNFKSGKESDHKEYLFYIQKGRTQAIFESPLNYTGSKSKEIGDITSLLPPSISTFVDVFGGGFNVGINVSANRIIYNDINGYVVKLIQSFKKNDCAAYLRYIDKLVKKFSLAVKDKEHYIAFRDYYNSLPQEKRDPKMLYTLILYGFQQQIRFNGNHEFNNPVGMRYFNDQLLSKFVSFSRIMRFKKVDFNNLGFEDIIEENLGSDAFFYCDPPYLNTTGAYNDGKRGFEGWTEAHEQKLRDELDKIHSCGQKFILSYVLNVNGLKNSKMIEWIKSRKYRLVEVKERQGRYHDREEVLILNY